VCSWSNSEPKNFHFLKISSPQSTRLAQTMKLLPQPLTQRFMTILKTVKTERRTVWLGLLTGAALSGAWLTSCRHSDPSGSFQPSGQTCTSTLPTPTPSYRIAPSPFQSAVPNHRTNAMQLAEPKKHRPPVKATSSDTQQLVVMKGDTLWSISKKHHIDMHTLKKFNHLKTNSIRAGQTLKLPIVDQTNRARG